MCYPQDGLDPPITLLIPHILSQEKYKSMCFSNVVTLIESLYIVSATEDNDKTGSPVRKKPMYRVTTKHYNHDDNLENGQPKSTLFVMNTISITPQNHFK